MKEDETKTRRCGEKSAMKRKSFTLITEDGAKTRRLDEVKKQIIRSAVVQVLVLGLTCLILDDGACFGIALFGVTAHWISAVVIVVRRKNALTQWDVVLLQAGFVLFPAAVLACVLAVVGVHWLVTCL